MPGEEMRQYTVRNPVLVADPESFNSSQRFLTPARLLANLRALKSVDRAPRSPLSPSLNETTNSFPV